MPVPVAFYDSDDLEGHVSIVQRQVQRSLEDRETRTLANKIVSGRPDLYVEDLPAVMAWGMTLQLAPPGPQFLGPAKNELDEINQIWNFLVLNVAYKLDPSAFELISTLRLMLEAGEEDCDGSTVAFGALLRARGFQVRCRVISTGGSHWEHIYAQVGLPKRKPTRWVTLDPTVKGATPGWEYADATHRADFKL
jgi:hypothetical protein